MESLLQEGRIRQCTGMIAALVNKNDRYATSDVEEYVRRIVKNMTDDELAVMETAIPSYAAKIQKKIDSLEQGYRKKLFQKWLDSGKIVCRDSYAPEPVITPEKTIDAIPYSLYEAEKNNMDGFELQVINVIAGMDNIRWWHRIIDRKGFRINGYINHYPDFMVMMKSGKLVMVEAKGDYLDGGNSKERLELGRLWQSQAGRMYRYFMVFKNKDFKLDGAYMLDEFVDLMKEL